MNKPVLPQSSLSLRLPTADRSIENYRLAASRTFPARLEGTLNRVAFSAAHVVADPLVDTDPWLTSAIDWDRTIAFREHVWDLGLGVAEAMDTAQRGMGLDWPTSLELIQRSVRAAKARGGALVFSGAGTDHLAVEDAKSIDDVIRAYEEQIEAVEKAGGRIILMASRALAKLGRNADDYAKVYNRVLSQVREPVIIHWLGDMFDPALQPIAAKLLYIEQPMPRDITRASPLGALAGRDFIIDEADDSYDAFPAARALGYRGISSKSCKGIYKSVINAARAAKWSAGGERYFISGEDLTCQAGLAVQQDLALGALIGVSHAERNGHHYVDGFADTPAAEAEAFLAAHPDLYASGGGKIRLAIHDGDLLTGSLTQPGFATSVHPDWSTLQPLARPISKIPMEHVR